MQSVTILWFKEHIMYKKLRKVSSQTKTTLEDLITRSQEGDTEAFRSIFDMLNERLFAYATSRSHSRDDALDITQETFIELWNSLEKFEYSTDEELYGFVFIILKRRTYHYYKAKKETLPINDETIHENYELEYEDHRHMMRAIESLADKYKDLLKLRYWSDMTFREIALVLNTNEATAKVWHHRALQKLKIHLAHYDKV